MEQTESLTVSERKPQLDNVVPLNTDIKSMFPIEISRTTEQMLANEISRLVAGSFDDILQCTNEKWNMGVCSVVYTISEQMLFVSLRRKVFDDILYKHIANYFDSIKAVDKIC